MATCSDCIIFNAVVSAAAPLIIPSSANAGKLCVMIIRSNFDSSNTEILHHLVSQHNHCCVMYKKLHKPSFRLKAVCAVPPHSVLNVQLVNLPARATQEEGRARTLSLRGRSFARRSSSLISVYERYK